MSPRARCESFPLRIIPPRQAPRALSAHAPAGPQQKTCRSLGLTRDWPTVHTRNNPHRPLCCQSRDDETIPSWERNKPSYTLLGRGALAADSTEAAMHRRRAPFNHTFPAPGYCVRSLPFSHPFTFHSLSIQALKPSIQQKRGPSNPIFRGGCGTCGRVEFP